MEDCFFIGKRNTIVYAITASCFSIGHQYVPFTFIFRYLIKIADYLKLMNRRLVDFRNSYEYLCYNIIRNLPSKPYGDFPVGTNYIDVVSAHLKGAEGLGREYFASRSGVFWAHIASTSLLTCRDKCTDQVPIFFKGFELVCRPYHCKSLVALFFEKLSQQRSVRVCGVTLHFNP